MQERGVAVDLVVFRREDLEIAGEVGHHVARKDHSGQSDHGLLPDRRLVETNHSMNGVVTGVLKFQYAAFRLM